MVSWINSPMRDELRDMWNTYDPIGVYHFADDKAEWSQDEYDGYHGITLKLLKGKADHYKFFKHLKQIVTVNMGITWNEQLEAHTNTFIKGLNDWFAKGEHWTKP